MISSDNIRGYNDLMILSLLKVEDSYAYALSKLMDEITEGKYIIKETTLYSAFTRLESNKFIESYILDIHSGGTKRKYYRITKLGLEYLNSKIEEWDTTKKVVSNILAWGGLE